MSDVRKSKSKSRADVLARTMTGESDWRQLDQPYTMRNTAASYAGRIKRGDIAGWAQHGEWDARVRKQGSRFYVQVKPAGGSQPVEPAVEPAVSVVEPVVPVTVTPVAPSEPEPEPLVVEPAPEPAGLWIEVNGQRVRIGEA